MAMTAHANSSDRRPATPAQANSSERSRWWPVRTARWVAERHGLGVLVPVALLFALSVAAGATETHGLLMLDRIQWWQIVGGAAGFWSWYLMLRVLDDLEDADADAVAHPDRLLSRGWVSRRDLWGLAALALLMQGIASRLADVGTETLTITFTWLTMVVFLAAVAVDFGVPGRLAKHELLRRTLRVPASVLPVLWAFAMGSVATPLSTSAPLSWTTLALVGVAFTTAALIDVVRKYAPASPGEPSWAARLGEGRAGLLLFGLLAAQLLSCFALTQLVQATWPLWASVVFLLVTLIGISGRERARAAAICAFVALAATSAVVIGAAV